MTDYSSAGPRAEAEVLVHFFLRDPLVHEMNALTLNRCIGDFLSLIDEVSKVLGVQVEVNSLAYSEGGVIAPLKLIGKHAVALTLLGGVVVAVSTAVDWVAYRAPLQDLALERGRFELERDRKIAEQTIEQNQLAIKRARIELERLERESATNRAPNSTPESQVLPLEDAPSVKDLTPGVAAHSGVVKHRSSFYKSLLNTPDVSGVGFTAKQDSMPNAEVFVGREKFVAFIEVEEALKPKWVEYAEIEIVAPVLRADRKLKWRGAFQGRPLTFEIEDPEFLRKVARKRVKFQAGTTIVAALECSPRKAEEGGRSSYDFVVHRVWKVFAADPAHRNHALRGRKTKVEEAPLNPQGEFPDFP